MYDKPTSFSQNNVFSRCKRWWWYQYIKKIPSIQDMSYALAGNVIHEVLQKYYDNELNDMGEVKVCFNDLWQKKDLHNSIIKNKVDDYKLMIINGINLRVPLTSTEMKIFYPDVVGYIDGVDSLTDTIIDWKSSTRRPENEEEYTKQMMFYSWLYHRKFGRLPQKAVVHYLKYTGTKGELTYNPKIEDVMMMERWNASLKKEMDIISEMTTPPPRCETCHMFCPYADICNNGNEDQMSFDLVIKGTSVYVQGPISDLLEKGINKKFSYELKNAYFMKQRNPHARTAINFWNQREKSLPIGFIEGIQKTIRDYAEHKKCGLSLKVIDRRQFFNPENPVVMPDKFLNGVVLRDYQVEAVDEFLKHKISLMELATGSGKTEISIELIRRLNTNTLFIVDKIELMKQTKKRIEDALGIEVGQLGRGVSDIRQITVATIQTITKNIKEYVPYLRRLRFVIFDECHHVASRSYLKLSQYLPATEYRLGVSGTSYRDDGNDMMITASTGYKVFDLGSKTLIEKGWLIRPQIIFIKDYMSKEDVMCLDNKCKTGLINETEKYADYYEAFITTNKIRNDIIKSVVEKNEGKKILILVKLVKHGNILADMIPGSKYLHGSMGKKERDDIFDDFTKGGLNVLIGTISIFAEGIDVPSLNMVINASANKGDVKTIQVLGRVLRKMEGKVNAQYIDFIDEKRFFRLASLSRRRALVKEGHWVETTNKFI